MEVGITINKEGNKETANIAIIHQPVLYVCMCVCMYVCMYVYMYDIINRPTKGRSADQCSRFLGFG